MGCDTIRYDSIRYDTIRYSTLRYDTVRYGTVRCDTIRYVTIRYDTMYISFHYERTMFLFLRIAGPTIRKTTRLYVEFRKFTPWPKFLRILQHPVRGTRQRIPSFSLISSTGRRNSQPSRYSVKWSNSSLMPHRNRKYACRDRRWWRRPTPKFYITSYIEPFAWSKVIWKIPTVRQSTIINFGLRSICHIRFCSWLGISNARSHISRAWTLVLK